MRFTFFRSLLAPAGALLLGGQALAFQAGMQPLEVPAATSGAPAIPVVLYYPTQAAEREVPMGPFTAHVAMGGAPEATVAGLILLSHGTGGSEIGHGRLAEGLARSGYLIAALRHPGDNWQDRSLLASTPARYFGERPRQASRVVDAVLADPQWKDRIARDATGPRIGAVGHSAGGYTVLALAGGRPDLRRVVAHCTGPEAAADALFCRTGPRDTRPAAAPPPEADVADPRVRAVAALAPVGVVFDAASLAAIRIPVALYVAEQDRWLQPRFHADWIAANLSSVQVHRVPNAWHFAFIDTPSMPLPTPDGDIGADPPGFDRAAFLAQLARDLPAFFDRSW